MIVIAAVGCSAGPSGPDRRAQLVHDLADVVYLPILRELPPQTAELVARSEALCAEPTQATLDAARQAWRAARAPYKRSEAFRFGPVADLRVAGAIDFWPARSADIEDELAQTAPITETYVGGLGSTRKGLPVLEYLLFGELERLHDGGSAMRACDYVVELARDVDRRARELVAAWEPSGGDFRGKLIDPGSGGSPYAKLSDAVAEAANGLFAILEELEAAKLAKPLGHVDGGIPQPEAVESSLADNGAADMAANLAGARAVYTTEYGGATGMSFSQAVADLDAQLDADVRAKFDTCAAAFQAMGRPLADAVVNDPAGVEAAFTCAKELYTLFVADVAGALGVTPTIGDVDGD